MSDLDLESSKLSKLSTPRVELMRDRDKWSRIWLKRYFDLLKKNQSFFPPHVVKEFNDSYPKDEKAVLTWLLTIGIEQLEY